MRKTFQLLLVTGLCLLAIGCEKSQPDATPAPEPTAPAVEPETAPAPTDATPAVSQDVAEQTLEVACAGCIFKMEGAEGCELAAKIDGKAYLVSGASFDAHSTGLCDASKQADAAGKIEGDKFIVTKMELKP